MKTNISEKTIISIIIIVISIIFVIYFWFSNFRVYKPNLEFQVGSWEMYDTENELKINLTYDGGFPHGVMFYDGEEFEIELLTRGSIVHLFIKGKNDSDFNFWLVGDGEIKSNGDIYLKNIKYLDEPFIDFKEKIKFIKDIRVASLC